MRPEQALPRLIGISVANAPQGPQSEVRRGDAGMEGVVPGQTGASEQRVHSMGADRWALDRRTVLTRAVAGVTCLSNPSDAGAVVIRVSGEGGWDMTPSPLHAHKERRRCVTFDGCASHPHDHDRGDVTGMIPAPRRHAP
jgi:hypothetical protein